MLSENLFIGIVIGLCIGIGYMFLSSNYYQKILILKAKRENRTPEKLGDNFYYVVPEDEYIEMEQNHLFWKYEHMENKIKEGI